VEFRTRFALVAVAVIVLAIAVWTALTISDVRRRNSPVELIEMPVSVVAYERLAAELDVSGDSTVDLGLSVEIEPTLFSSDAADIVAGYDRLFARIEELQERDDVPPHNDPARWAENDIEQIAAFLRANPDLIEQIRQMAERGAPVYPIDLSRGAETELPHLGPIRDCAGWLRADAAVRVRQADYSEAVEDVMAGMRLGDALAPEPLVISQLVRIAVCGVMIDTIERYLIAGDLSSDHVQQLIYCIGRADNRDAFADAMATEAYMGSKFFADRRESAGGLFNMLYTSAIGRYWLNRDEELYFRTMNQMADVARRPYYEARPVLDDIAARVNDTPSARLYSRVLLPQVAPALTRAYAAQARHEAMLDLARMGLIIEQYHGQYGSYPSLLEELTIELGGSIPVDPFTGERYHYDPSGDSFQLYSVGPNLTDDGGRHDIKQGDIVWRARTD